MELLEEPSSNQVEDKSEENKNEDNSLKENGVQKSLSKKKFANTNFALKMKNKRKEEKLNNLETKETTDSCKHVSIDVTRLNSNPMPTLNHVAENRNRKRKRSQWKLGIMKKKKKPFGKDMKTSPLKKELLNGVGESNVTENIKTESIKIKMEEPIHQIFEKKKQADTPSKESSQRRKSLRSVTSSTSDPNVYESESKVDSGLIAIEHLSCRRTEPFIGKLLTKEARDEIANRILKAEAEKVASNNAINEKNIPSENKESKTEVVNKSLFESNTNIETNDKTDEKADKSTKPIVMDANEKMVNHPSRRSSSKITVAKESVKIEDLSCSRTMPFVGKTVRKLHAGVPERPIDIDTSTNQSDKKSLSKDNTNNLDSTVADKNKLSDSPKDKNTNAESTLGIKILCVSSLQDDNSITADCLTKKVIQSANEPITMLSKEAIVDSNSSNKIHMDLDTAANKIEAKSMLSKSTRLDTPITSVEEQTDCLSKKMDTTREIIKSSSSSTKTESSSPSNISTKKDSLFAEFNSKPIMPTVKDVHVPWSCQRVLPFRGKTSCYLEKQLVTENASNQTETPSTALKINSVSSNVLTVPSEYVSDKFGSEETSLLPENISQNEIRSDPISKVNEEAKSILEPLNDCETRSSTTSPILNGEWKFRRKRQILSSDDENEENEIQKTKTTKIQSSNAKKYLDKAPVTPRLAPGKPICSFFSPKCIKHEHYSEDGPCPTSNHTQPKAYVLLPRLEYMKDPEVKKYLLKTDFVNTIKKSYRRILVNKDISDTSKMKRDREKSISTSTQATKDNLVSLNESEIAEGNNSSTSFGLSNEYEKPSNKSISAIKSRRRTSSRISPESQILHAKRRKGPVNYLEHLSDTDDEKESSQQTPKLQQSSQGSILHNRDKLVVQSILERDENDMEVEEFSRVGRQNRTEDSNQEDSEQDANCSRTKGIKAADVSINVQARCKSVAERKISDTLMYPTRSKTPHIGMPMEQNVVLSASDIDNKKLEEDLVQGLKSMEESINKEMEKMGLIPTGSSQRVGKKTIDRSRQVSNESLPSTPSVLVNKSLMPKNIVGAPSQNETTNPSNTVSITPRRSVSFQRNELLAKVTKSASELLEADRKKEMKLKDIRVQLIKLEAVCSDYKDYSAGEIELLTNKYIDMLMNSNFACDTWRVNPIKLATTYTRTIDLRGNEGDSDCESPDNEPLPFEEVQVPMDSANMDFDATAEQNTINESLRHKSSTKSGKQPTDLESAMASFSQKISSPEKTFGAINISDVLSQPAANEEDTEYNRTADSNIEDDANENDDSAVAAKVSSVILVNGTEMHTCNFCNKIFVEKELLQKHLDEEHDISEKSSIGQTISSKSAKKQAGEAPGPASSKKAKSRKLRCNESLQCTICSETFGTKELLFDHIMTHNEKDLQQAYKAAKLAKLQESGETNVSEHFEEEQTNSKKQKQKNLHNRRKSTDSASTAVSGEELATDDSAKTTTSSTDSAPQQIANSGILVTARTLPATSSNNALTICQCHAHELTTQDLHIEMVLLCTACNVIFRRRDCFEIHFRTSSECRRKRANSEVTKVPKLFCSGCRCILNSLMEMRAHLEEHAQKNCTGTVTFLCNICKVAFFGVGGIFYSHWFNHAKSPNFVASRYSFPKLSVVSVLEDINGTMTTSKSQEGFFYIAEHVCRECRLPFSSDPELQKHKEHPCLPPQPVAAPRAEPLDNNRLQMIKLICDLCKKYYVSKDNFDKHCNDRNHLKTPITKFSRLPINATDQVFVCSLCRGLSKTLDEMKEHWKRVHSPIMELYTCKTCNVVPSNDVANYTYEKFESHCRMVHKSEVITCLVYFVTARYVCGICKFGFETEKSMKEHELVHQKKIPIQSAPVQTNTAAINLGNTQSTTFYVTDAPQVDGGRRLHPVVVQYPNINGSAVGPVAIGQCSLPNQPHLQSPSQMNTSIAGMGNQILMPSTSVIRMPNTTAANTDVNSELRNTWKGAVPGHNQQQSTAITQEQQQSKVTKIVETIELDSRSNSPILDSSAPSTSGNSNSLAATKKAYMTKVNPNFETILATTVNQENRNNSSTPESDKSRDNRDDNSTLVEVDTLTPQPFEVVLVTDELSENSDQNKNDNQGSTLDEHQPQQQAVEIIETKSFLRVRSVAELQSIKIHLCSVCGLNFDTPHAFEQHERQHRISGEVGRSTPVQMISPMLSPGSKEATDDPNNALLTQIKQKLALGISNGPSGSTVSTNVNTRVMPSVLPHQPVLPPQQQQSWYPTSSNTNTMISNINYATNQPLQQQQQSVLRQTINSAQYKNSYTTIRPPPPYPGASNSMVASGRPSAIQLPERSTAGSIPPQTKRPSGAATRIPQQSLQSYEDMNSRQTVSSVWGYSSGGTMAYNPSPQQCVVQKTYGPASSTVNYSTVNGPVNYQSVPQSQSRQQQPQKNIIYTCKHPNCFYRSASLAGIRAHETIHLLPQQGQQHQQVPTTSNNHQQQQQQPPRLLPVSQMPERTRHALPTSRPPGASNNQDKRITCRICNLNCATSIELIEHVSTVHSGANQVCCYVCDYCPSPLIFDTEDQLRKHMNISHNHSCEICNKRYPSKEDLMLHMEVHMRRP